MRVVRNGLVALGAVATAPLVCALGVLAPLSSPASAATASVSTQLSIGQVRLGPLGASVSVLVVFRCDPSLNVAFADANVSQESGHRLAQGFGSFYNRFPGVPCTGASQSVTVPVTDYEGFAFKQGTRVMAGADLNLFDPVSGNLSTTTITAQSVRIFK
jgi:hypothetical protein